LSADPVRTARWRLALRFTLVVTVLFVTSGAVVYVYVRHMLLGAFDAAHDLAIHSVLENVEPAIPKPRVAHAPFATEFEELNLTLGVVAVKVWSADGEPLAEAAIDHAPLTADGPPRELRGAGNRAVVIRRQPFGVGPTGGSLAVSRRAGDVALDLESLQQGLMLIVPLAMLGALGVGWVMAGQSPRPRKRAFEQQRAFMADTSHELRTPLSVIRAHAEVHLDGEPPKMRAALSVVARTAAQLSAVVDDLMFLARADAAALSPRRIRFSLDELVEETVEAFEPEAKAKGSRLVLAPRSKDIELEADPAQLQRLVAILVDNAVRHAAPGEIDISMAHLGKQVELRIESGGPGIPPDLLPRVFDRFVRGDRARAAEDGGLGLGLAIAKSIVSAHAGTIRLQNGARGGVAAVVRIPQTTLPGRLPRPIADSVTETEDED